MTYPKEKLKVIVVDDGSTDGTYAIAKEYPGVTVYRKENEGCKAFPVNYGLKKVRSDLVFILDADCMPAKDWLTKQVQYMKDENTMAAMSQIKMYRPRGLISALQEIEFSLSSFIRKNLFFIKSVNLTPGAALFKMKFFKEHGDFDTNSIVEDFEIGMRIKSFGYDIAQAIDTYIMTYPHRKVKGLARERLRWSYGYFTVFKKYGYMFGLKHGELGIFYLPISLFFIVIPIIMAGRALLVSLEAGALRGGMWSGVGYDFAYSIANFKLIIPFKFVYYLIAMMVVLGFLAFLIARRLSNLSKSTFFIYPLYTLFYIFFLGVVNSLAVAMFFLGIKPKWAVSRSIQT
jgi:biofilm PGA synthesis N-glycosyltransferase PgaC